MGAPPTLNSYSTRGGSASIFDAGQDRIAFSTSFLALVLITSGTVTSSRMDVILLPSGSACTRQARPGGTGWPGPKGPSDLGTWAPSRQPGNCQPDLGDEDAG